MTCMLGQLFFRTVLTRVAGSLSNERSGTFCPVEGLQLDWPEKKVLRQRLESQPRIFHYGVVPIALYDREVMVTGSVWHAVHLAPPWRPG